MDTKTWIDIALALWTIFGGVITYGLHKLFTAKTKNANLNSFNKWVDQSITHAEQSGATTGPGKKKEAIDYLTQVLKDNNLLGKFSSEEMSAAIELGLKLLPGYSVDNNANTIVEATTGVTSPLVKSDSSAQNYISNSISDTSDKPLVMYTPESDKVASSSLEVSESGTTLSNGTSSVSASDSGLTLSGDSININGSTTYVDKDNSSEATYVEK